MLLRDNVQFS